VTLPVEAGAAHTFGDVLLIVDVINDLSFPGGEKVLPWAKKLATRLDVFRSRAHRHQMPVIYANDHFGRWRSNWGEIYAHATRASARGREMSRTLKPARQDLFILKPMHSAFYATALVPLLDHLKCKRIVLAGIATNLCVLITAHDAHMRGYPLVVLSDCCAAESDFDHNVALGQLERYCGAEVCLSGEFGFG